eukprot:gene2263-2593_t
MPPQPPQTAPPPPAAADAAEPGGAVVWQHPDRGLEVSSVPRQMPKA